jgi:hypothetical protein
MTQKHLLLGPADCLVFRVGFDVAKALDRWGATAERGDFEGSAR